MQTRQAKLSCTVELLDDSTPDGAQMLDGMAHLVETVYDEHFTSWFAAVEVTVADHGAEAFWRLAQLRLEDGRGAMAMVVAARGETVQSTSETPLRLALLYLQGLWRLIAQEKPAEVALT